MLAEADVLILDEAFLALFNPGGLGSLWRTQAFSPNGAAQSVTAFNLFLMLAMAHFVAGFALQGDRMAVEKCPGQQEGLGWGWWLCAHAAIHGFFVGWLSGMPLLGLAEWLLHGLIDLGKCRRRFGLGVDQSLHLIGKLAWAGVAVSCSTVAGLLTASGLTS